MIFTDDNFKTDLVIFHGDEFVYVAVPSCSLSIELYDKAKKILAVDPILTSNIREKIMTMEKDSKYSWPNYSANFGLSYYQQPSIMNSENPDVQSRAKLMGVNRGRIFVKVPKSISKHSFVSKVSTLYKEKFLPSFKSDRKFGFRQKQQRPRMCETFMRRKKMYFPSPLNSSLPNCEDTMAIEVGMFENKLRTISEWILTNVFMPLPYSQVAYITSQKMAEVNNLVMKKKRFILPCSTSNRLLPKGTLCNVYEKPLHDDDNGCITPSIWTNLIEDEYSFIQFHSTNMKIQFRCTTTRFLWFMGYIPHMTKSEKRKHVKCGNNLKSPIRISHSAYSKSIHEFMYLHLFDDKVKKESLNLCFKH